MQIQSPEQFEEAAEQYEEKGSRLENVVHARRFRRGGCRADAPRDAATQMVSQAMAYGDDTTVAAASPTTCRRSAAMIRALCAAARSTRTVTASWCNCTRFMGRGKRRSHASFLYCRVGVSRRRIVFR